MLSWLHVYVRSTLRAVSADGLRSFVGPAVDIIPPSSVEDMKVIQCHSCNYFTNKNILISQENFIGAASSFVEKRTEYHLLRLLSAGSCSTAELSDRFTQAGVVISEAALEVMAACMWCAPLRSQALRFSRLPVRCPSLIQIALH